MSCRLCGGGDLEPVIDLGLMPAVNNLLEHPDDPCPRWPLEVVFCRDCSLAQLTEAPPPDALFREYSYFSGQSQTMAAHARRLVAHHVTPGQRVVEIASNDGYLLRPAQNRGAVVLGVDPARNVAEHATAHGIPTVCAYFDGAFGAKLRDEQGPADVIFANNVLAHVPDPNEIAAGIAALLAADGRAHVEVPWVVELVDRGAFDTIYHEHQCYFSATALRALFARHGLRIAGCEVIPIHGGSLHVTVARAGDEDEIEALCARETARGAVSGAMYDGFEQRVAAVRRGLEDALAGLQRVAGYGAAAKAVVLLNTFELGPDRIAWVADVSAYKQGRYVPGTGQPIVPPARLLEEMPEACVLFPWNIAAEIRRRNAEYLKRGGRFITAIEEVAPS